jgi:hypothetical protein
VEVPGRRIESEDFRPQEGYLRQGAKAAQIQAPGLGREQTRHYRRHRTGVVEAAVAVHQGDAGGGGPPLGRHDPAPQQEGMGVAAAGQHQVMAPTGGIQRGLTEHPAIQ